MRDHARYSMLVLPEHDHRGRPIRWVRGHIGGRHMVRITRKRYVRERRARNRKRRERSEL